MANVEVTKVRKVGADSSIMPVVTVQYSLGLKTGLTRKPLFELEIGRFGGYSWDMTRLLRSKRV